MDYVIFMGWSMTSTLRTRPGKNTCMTGSLQAVCQSVQDLVRIPKESLWKTHPVQVWPGSQGNNREAETFNFMKTNIRDRGIQHHQRFN